MRKSKLYGCITGIILMSSISVGAMGIVMEGGLKCKNPLSSAPYGYAWTQAPKGPLTAKVSVSKKGYTTRSKAATYKGTGRVDTPKLYGPTYVSKGTNFRSDHVGYNNKGKKQLLVCTKKY